MTTRPGSRPRSPQPARSDQPRAWRHDPRRRFPPPRDLERDADPDRDASRGNAQRGFHDRRPRLRNGGGRDDPHRERSEEHTSELQSLMRISYAVFCLKKKKKKKKTINNKKQDSKKQPKT